MFRNGANTLLYQKYISPSLNGFNLAKFMLEKYGQITLYSKANLLNNYVLYPVLMEVIKHKVIVLVILAFI